MAENRQCSPVKGQDMVCIDTHRILDSCRDKDCFEDVVVYLTDFGQEIIEKTSAVRAKSAHVLWAYIDIENVPFNRGFYQLTVKIYTKIVCEACLGPGNVRTFDGLAVVEKKVILFGSEGSVSIFRSEAGCPAFCPSGKCGCTGTTNLPEAVVETVDPIVLSSKVAEPQHCHYCCSCCDDLPERVCESFCGTLGEYRDSAKLLVSLGFFTVIRIERPAQYLVAATEYNVPNKECRPAETNDPCSMFRQMSFPVAEFSNPPVSLFGDGGMRCQADERGKCSCDDVRRCGCDG